MNVELTFQHAITDSVFATGILMVVTLSTLQGRDD